MYSHSQLIIITVVTALLFLYHCLLASCQTPFDDNYYFTYGSDHARFLNNERTDLEISLDQFNGVGFGSKQNYGSGFFQMLIRHPPGDTTGVVTTFYLRSGDNQNDELDFEFLGNKPGQPVILQTNVFTSGVGNREERTLLWFDPSEGYHFYRILWNQNQIVFFVDNVPIRVFKNLRGVGYPSKPMQVLASIWNGDWATNGGRDKIDWSHAPFSAQYSAFAIYGCAVSPNAPKCNSQDHFWSIPKLTPIGESRMMTYRTKYLTYTYCTDKNNHPVTPPECHFNN